MHITHCRMMQSCFLTHNLMCVRDLSSEFAANGFKYASDAPQTHHIATATRIAQYKSHVLWS